jgi:hypothetical protein
MARLSLFSVVFLSLFLVANANPSQELLPDGTVHTAEDWSWSDCGQPFV